LFFVCLFVCLFVFPVDTWFTVQLLTKEDFYYFTQSEPIVKST